LHAMRSTNCTYIDCGVELLRLTGEVVNQS
jgi:hypothetical protein